MIHLHLDSAPETSVQPSDAHAVHDLMWAHAAPRHHLEHVRARVVPGGIGLVLFIGASAADEADSRAEDLMDGVRDSGVLAQYRISAG
ncbi:hypothetical protein OG912_25500 [Streptomyces sp. NBC_00464]|uniref:hypothetical protein n=1 Tax=Streptomyces sp. NBC_00464 TaxID=2975751 RepID=UPI002E18A36B